MKKIIGFLVILLLIITNPPSITIASTNQLICEITNPDDGEVVNDPNIVVEGYATGQMIAQFSTDPFLNPGEWKGKNWYNSGYNIYSFFPIINSKNCNTKLNNDQVEDNFYFIQITDPYIKHELFDNAKSQNKLKSVIYYINSLDEKPAFVIITGNLVDSGSGLIGILNYNTFIECLYKKDNQLYTSSNCSIPVYTTPGNQDYHWNLNLINYKRIIDNNNIFNKNRYTVNYNNLTLFFLNSGHDYLSKPKEINRGSGLLRSDIKWLENNLINYDSQQKIIIMHHPVINSDENGTIARNRDELIDLCNKYDVELVLSGHTHTSQVFVNEINFISNDKLPINCSQYSTLHVHTASIKDGYYYRKINVSSNEIILNPCLQIIDPNLQNLPIPILDEHPGWLDLYNKTWEIAKTKVRHGTEDNGFVVSYIDEGFKENIFQWDTIFMMMFLRYGYNEFPSIISLDNFYRKQKDNGYICRELCESNGLDYWAYNSTVSINPPLFSWAEWEHYRITGDKDRLIQVLPNLMKYFNWIKENRRWSNGLYWSSDFASGMDNSPRGAKENIDEKSHYDLSWIDISSQQAINAKYISLIASELEMYKLSNQYTEEYNELKQLINEKMWCKTDGIYYDLDKYGEFTEVKTIASFWPLLAGIANITQTQKLIQHLQNPQEFWRIHVFPSLSADHPSFKSDGGYWQGSIWAPTNYMVIKGLQYNGFEELATDAAENHIENIYQIYKETGTLWENYAPDMVKQGNPSKSDFVGWTGCSPISLLIENIIGIRTNASDDLIFWNLNLTEKHGIKNLRFGDNNVTLLCEKREKHNSSANITIITDSDFNLKIKIDENIYYRSFSKGKHNFIIGEKS